MYNRASKIYGVTFGGNSHLTVTKMRPENG